MKDPYPISSWLTLILIIARVSALLPRAIKSSSSPLQTKIFSLYRPKSDMIPNSKVTVLVATAALGATLASAQNKPTFRVENLPKTWEQGQVGSNQCEQWGASSQSSMCQNIFINSVNDFCLWAPFKGQGTVGAQEE